jgi:hypothetical protein
MAQSFNQNNPCPLIPVQIVQRLSFPMQQYIPILSLHKIRVSSAGIASPQLVAPKATARLVAARF